MDNLFTDTSEWRNDICSRSDDVEPLRGDRVLSARNPTIRAVAAAAALATTMVFSVYCGPDAVSDHPPASSPDHDAEWEELRKYAESQGEDFDRLVNHAAEVVSRPLAKAALADEDLEALVADELDYAAGSSDSDA